MWLLKFPAKCITTRSAGMHICIWNKMADDVTNYEKDEDFHRLYTHLDTKRYMYMKMLSFNYSRCSFIARVSWLNRIIVWALAIGTLDYNVFTSFWGLLAGCVPKSIHFKTYSYTTMYQRCTWLQATLWAVVRSQDFWTSSLDSYTDWLTNIITP